MNGISVPGNNAYGDLWFYVAVVVPPLSNAVNGQVTINAYTSCFSTDHDNTQDGYIVDGSPCIVNDDPTTYPPIPSENQNVPPTLVSNNNFESSGPRALYRNTSKLFNVSDLNLMKGPASRDITIGYSHWADGNLNAKVKNVRVWNTALPVSQLGAPFTTTYRVDQKTSTIISDPDQNSSLRISPLYSNNNDRLLLFTVNEPGYTFKNTFRLVSCAWNTKIPRRVTRSLRFRVVGNNRPEILEYLPY